MDFKVKLQEWMDKSHAEGKSAKRLTPHVMQVMTGCFFTNEDCRVSGFLR